MPYFIMHFSNNAVKSRCDRDAGFVRLNFADLVKLSHLKTRLALAEIMTKPSLDSTLSPGLTNHSLMVTSLIPSPMSDRWN